MSELNQVRFAYTTQFMLGPISLLFDFFIVIVVVPDANIFENVDERALPHLRLHSDTGRSLFQVTK